MRSQAWLHAGPSADADLAFAAVLTLATLGSAALFGLGVAAFLRRQSRSYLLVALALAALLSRSVVAGFAITGHVSASEHHLLEHALDAVMVGLVVGAVYHARTVARRFDHDP
ncbi:hypothetical protein ACFQPA_00960 [Halomarina halobia]|uniref:Uncharacterized protein n=1 Tax=Halomarina halobia TaxID=3033386 RepID=A0ABD6A6X9_9EURY|nr:hypothetical protein [Halomarina sp. PSR21]